MAAILAADVAGYSRLMGADEEGTLVALKAIRRELVDPKMQVAGAAVLAATRLRRNAATGLAALPPGGTRRTDRHVPRSPNEG